MKNKLLLTTAIAGLTAIAGVANAETKVSGNLEQTFKSSSYSSTPATSGRSLGAEYNIGLSSSAELNNGLSAKFGFNIESNEDGAADTGVTDSHYLSIGNDQIQFVIGRDNGQNLSSTVIPHISDQAGTVVDGETLGNVGSVDAHNFDHVRLDAAVLGGTVTLRYAPDNGAGTHNASSISDTGTSQQEIIYSGSLGVEGLKVQAGISQEDKVGSNVEDQEYKKIGVSYNFGQFAVGAERAVDTAGTTSKVELTRNTFGLTFAANDNLSFGVNYGETEKETAGVKSTTDQEVLMVGIGYNLGGIAVDINYADVSDLGNSAGADAELFQIRTIQKF